MRTRLVSRRLLLAGAPLLAFLTSGCSYTGYAQQAIDQEDALNSPIDLRDPTYRSVDWMYHQLRELHPHLLGTQTVVGSVADIRDMNRSTPLGNVISELVRTRLVQLGIPVVDMRLRSEIRLSPSQGELVLSRNPRKVYPAPVAGMICSGTYAVGRASVFVSLKIIRATNADILAAAEFRLPRTFDVRRLLVGPVAEADGASRG